MPLTVFIALSVLKISFLVGDKGRAVKGFGPLPGYVRTVAANG